MFVGESFQDVGKVSEETGGFSSGKTVSKLSVRISWQRFLIKRFDTPPATRWLPWRSVLPAMRELFHQGKSGLIRRAAHALLLFSERQDEEEEFSTWIYWILFVAVKKSS